LLHIHRVHFSDLVILVKIKIKNYSSLSVSPTKGAVITNQGLLLFQGAAEKAVQGTATSDG
jgi:hypothetical protein